MEKYEDMTNQQLVEAFKNYHETIRVSRSNIGFYIRNHNKELYAEIEKRTAKLSQYKRISNGIIRDVSIFERIYCLEHGLDDRPMCKECNEKHVGFMIHKNAYCDYCSQYCQKHSSIPAYKGIQTKKQKYGEDNVVNQKKAHETRMSKYGSHHPKDYAKKVKATKKKNHGDENYVNAEKMKQTVDRHIKENPSYYYDREQKTKQTKIANGHDPNWNNRKKFKETIAMFSDEKKESIVEKRKQTCLDDYGVESIAHLDAVKQQKTQTCLDKYGKTTFLATEECQTKSKIAKKRQAWKYFTNECKDIQPLFTEEEFMNCQMNERQKTWRWKCKKCGHEFIATWSNWSTRKCPKCFPRNFRGMQTEVEDFIKSLCVGHDVTIDGKNVLENSRQLDIYIEDLKLAIEFNGLFWHNSDLGAHGRSPTPMMYHYGKSIECESKGIQLVHIFEDEWKTNEKLCKSKLKKIAFPEKVRHIDANLCAVIKDINNEMKHKMLCKYSFFGDDGSSVQYGLVYNGHLVAMMTFSKARNNQQQCQWQILNYVEVNTFIIDNGFGALLDAFAKDYNATSIRLYASFDWATKSTYAKWMDFIACQDPRLYWTHNGERIKGTAISKDNAHSILETYDDTKPFQQNMNDNGYLRIYDSGTLVFEKKTK